jgi:uncharacterized damage-inducible protein DinB
VLGYVNKLIDHLEWADAAVLDALRSSPGSDARALVIYNHVVAVEAVWLARIAGRPSDVAVWPTLTLDELAQLGPRNVAALRALLSDGESGLARVIDYRNTSGQPFRNTIEDILLHVALHGSYHRGQVALLVRSGGGEPASTDYIGFIRGAPTARTVPPTPIA